MANMVATTPNRTASGVASGAAAIEARPAMAVLRPIIEAEWPRVSRMMLSSGMPSPMAMPTTLMDAIAAAMDNHRMGTSSACDSMLPVMYLSNLELSELKNVADETVSDHSVEGHWSA